MSAFDCCQRHQHFFDIVVIIDIEEVVDIISIVDIVEL